MYGTNGREETLPIYVEGEEDGKDGEGDEVEEASEKINI